MGKKIKMMIEVEVSLREGKKNKKVKMIKIVNQRVKLMKKLVKKRIEVNLREKL